MNTKNTKKYIFFTRHRPLIDWMTCSDCNWLFPHCQRELDISADCSDLYTAPRPQQQEVRLNISQCTETNLSLELAGCVLCSACNLLFSPAALTTAMKRTDAISDDVLVDSLFWGSGASERLSLHFHSRCCLLWVFTPAEDEHNLSSGRSLLNGRCRRRW